jgi:acetylornithine deacetylase/succinyl-diaminopimelate desuccinylase-like protein
MPQSCRSRECATIAGRSQLFFDMITSRAAAIDDAARYFDSGAFRADLERRVGYRTESQEATRAPTLRAYLSDEIAGSITPLGFVCDIVDNPDGVHGPFLIAERREDATLPTVLVYGHGDVVRGYDEQWRKPFAPWSIGVEGDRWYGRGTADNKGQHSIVLGALASVLAARTGALGYNVRLLLETGEEVGSPGLHEICRRCRSQVAADVLIASDGPRLSAGQPTLFLGSRGCVNFALSLRLRDGGHHSGNWGGLLANPATMLAHAIASMIGPQGTIEVDGLRSPPLPEAVRRALEGIRVGGDAGDPDIDEAWGEPGLSPAERVFGANTLEVLAMKAGNPDNPVNAIPPGAIAHCQLRFVVGTDWQHCADHVRHHLAQRGWPMIEVSIDQAVAATRLPPDDPWVEFAIASLERTTAKRVAVLPNLGGTLPNDAFAELLELPTIWVPHSYPGCSQHAPNEHLLAPVAREGLQMMAGLFWDLGDEAVRIRDARRRGV